MEAVPYENFSNELHQRVLPHRIPINGAIEVTHRCPMICAHCYNNLPMSDQQALLRELSAEEHCRILDEMAEAGCLWLLYTGGEIFAREDFLDIYTYAKQQGFLITLFTNGILVDERLADYLVRYRPLSIEITLYGSTKETYEAVTSVPGSYEKCLRGIRLLMERDLPVELKTLVVLTNKHEIWDIKRFAEDELGLEFKFDAMINPRLDHSQEPLALRLTPEEVVSLDVQDSSRLAEWHRFCAYYTAPISEPGQCVELYQCGAGVSSFAIDPSGMLSVCGLSSGDSYDLKQGTFRDGWEDSVFRRRQKKITRQTKCVACEIKTMCGMCPANGELENGDPEEPVDFLCRVAHLRSYKLGLSVSPHGDCEYCKGGSKYEDLLQSLAFLRP